MKKGFSFNLIKKDTSTLIKAYRLPLLMVSVLMGFLLFIMNVFLAGALYGNHFNTSMKEKLGVYIYLKDGFWDQKEQAVAIKSELEAQGLKVDYTSKQDALAFVEKRVMDLTTTLKKYDLENPLPSTLYIMYNDQQQFDAMKAVLQIHQNLILNMDDLSDNAIKTQEKRVLNIINLSNFIQSFGYLVVVIMLVTIINFAIFFLKTMFSHFRRDIQAKKLLGARASQIAQPFLRVIFMALAFACMLALLLLVGASIPLDQYLVVLFDFSLINYISQIMIDVLAIWILEIILIMLLLMVISYRYVLTLHKKLR